jgi:hypothetical protein
MRRELRFLLGYYSPPDDEPSVDGFFVELVRDNMAVLSAAQDGLSARDCGRLSEALANIGHAAEAMGYPVVKAALDGIGAELAGMGKRLSPQRRAKILDKLPPAQALIRDMVCLAETGAI